MQGVTNKPYVMSCFLYSQVRYEQRRLAYTRPLRNPLHSQSVESHLAHQLGRRTEDRRIRACAPRPTTPAFRHIEPPEWTPESIRAYVDDQHYFTFRNERLENPAADDRHWPFDHPFHFVLNIAVGGTWGGQEGVDPDIWPQRMAIDYARVYDCRSDG